ncbi:pentalenene synthase [Streptomyces sp. NPDC093675]|uniref:terpene synthase family protein n=1 Tax=Streptomyces sp. NPDC093675 TaxID=3366049 RepID=UPI0037FD2948
MGSYADVAARFHPTATGDDLDLAVDQQSWFFLFDDLFDGPAGTDPDRVRELVSDVAGAFEGSASARHPLARAFADLWARSIAGMSEAWRARAAADWHAYLGGYVDEALGRGRQTLPRSSEHLALRTRTIGALPVLDMAERVGHYECPACALESPAVREMRRLAVEVVILDNDIVSVEKEEAVGHVNVVSLLEGEYGCSRAEAIDRMRAMVAERTERFIVVRRELPTLARGLGLDDRDRAALERYERDALQTLMRGAYDWDQQAERYRDDFVRISAADAPQGVSS